VGSGRRRRAILDAGEFRMLDGGQGKIAGRREAHGSETRVENEHGHDCGEGKNGMGAGGRKVNAALAAVLFAGFLHCHEIVADGDYWKQNRDEDHDGDNLAAAICAGAITDAEPQANDQ